MKEEIKVPAVGESVSEGTLAEWNKQDGDFVERDDVLLVLETDKASVEIVAEHSGKLSIAVEEGEDVEVGAVLGYIDTDAKGSTNTKTEKESGDSSKNSAATTTLSPAVRKLVAETDVNPNTPGSGKGGRLTKGDVLQLQKESQSKTEPTTEAKTSEKSTSLPDLPKVTPSAENEIKTLPMSRLRQTIAKRLVEAQHNAAILTTFNEIDMSAVMELRKKYKDDFNNKFGVNLGFMGFFVKATCAALKQFPLVNSSIEGTNILQPNFVNMGIAVGTPKGLMVPVLQNADKMSLAEIENSIKHYALKARDGKISIEDLQNGTFTISNGGVYGSLMSTPILNPPQSGILGLHKIEKRPVAVNDQVVIRPMMYIALSYDHRVIDGKESVSFLVKIKEGMEDPARLLLDI